MLRAMFSVAPTARVKAPVTVVLTPIISESPLVIDRLAIVKAAPVMTVLAAPGEDERS